jgi:hypothetical protein
MRLTRRTLLGAAAGLAAGAVAGGCVLALTGTAIARGLGSADRDPATLIEATHLPPLLTLPGEAVTLRYDVYCAPAGADPESGVPCDAAGTVFVRAGDSGGFRAIPLGVEATASQGRYSAAVPSDIAGAVTGFSYYAVLRSKTSGASTQLPGGGPLAPMRSRPLSSAITVSLGAHQFGLVRRATARVVSASWGGGPGQVGLEPGPEQQPIGGSSFDVGPGGAVSLLDEAKRRVLRFSPGAGTPAVVPLGVRGTIADMAVGADGGMAVLETVGDDGGTPLVRSFDAAGRSLGAWHIAERRASSVEIAPAGPVVLGYPAGQWMPVAENGAGLSAASQRRRARGGRVLGNGEELVVERVGGEARIAQIGPKGIRRSWRIQSATSLGEMQLAKPLGDKLVVVLRVYTDTRDEFDVLVLDDKGLAKRFSIDSAAWAETAPLARFRLRGSALYELGSTPAGVYVNRYDLEVSR